MQRVGMLWLARELSGSTFWSSLVVAAQLLPTVIAGPVFGAYADRVPLAGAMLRVQFVLAGLTTGLFAIAFADLASIGIPIVFEVLFGITLLAHQPLRMALVPALVPKDIIPRAVAIDAMVFNVTRMVGPALAALLVVMSGVPPVVLMGALGNVVLAPVIWTLRNEVGGRAAARTGLLSQLRDGWMVVRDSRGVTKAFLITGIFGLGGRATIDLFPLFAASAFDREADGAGLLLSAAGGGALCAAAVMASVKVLPRYLGDTLVLIGLVALAVLAQTESWSLGLACAAILGCAASVVGAANQSKIQTSISDGLYGRVMSLWMTMGFGSTAVGTLTHGVPSEMIGSKDASASIPVLGFQASQ